MSSKSDRWDHSFRPPLQPNNYYVGVVYDEDGYSIPCNGRSAEDYVVAFEGLSDRGIAKGNATDLRIIAMATERINLRNKVSWDRLRGIATRPSARPVSRVLVELPFKMFGTLVRRA